VLETDDPLEIVTELSALKTRPRLAAELHRGGRATARAYVWDRVIDQLLLRIEFAAARQAAPLSETPAAGRKVPRSDTAMMDKK